MSQTAARASGLVHVTVASTNAGRTRRVDLALPGAVPVAELLPELARAVGALDATSAYAGFRLLTHDGRVLRPETGLAPQGVDDGGLLLVAAGVDETPERVYDDVVEAMADVVETDLVPWRPESGRRTALGVAVVAMTLGGYTLWLGERSAATSTVALIVAVVLLAAAVALSRVRDEHAAAVVVAWLGAGYAGLAALVARRSEPETLLLATGGAVLAAGVVGLLGLADRRPLLLPPVVLGGLLAAIGGLVAVTDWPVAETATGLLCAVVVMSSVFPWLALSAAPVPTAGADGLTDPDRRPDAGPASGSGEPDIDPDAVRRGAALAHDLLLGVVTATGAALVVLAPFAVGLGVAGAVVAVLGCVALALRIRQYRVATEVWAGLGGAVAGLASTVVAALLLHPSWHQTMALVLAVAGAVLLAVTLLPARESAVRGRLGDLAESVALVALLPALLVALGAVAAVRG